MVYHSDSDSEEGDPRYKVGSRFSNYNTGSNNRTSNHESVTPKEPIEEQSNEDVKAKNNGFMESSRYEEEEKYGESGNAETVGNEETWYNDPKQNTEHLERINFNSIEDGEEDDPESSKMFQKNIEGEEDVQAEEIEERKYPSNNSKSFMV